jgi:very-short-patch-repair endonuclease
LIKDKSKLNQRETEFALNPNSHLDFLIFSRINQKPVLAIEVDGFKFHDNNEKQLERDAVKNSILEKFNIPLLRFSTIGSQEQVLLKKTLEHVS